MTIPLSDATKRNPLMINSLAIITITIHAANRSISTRQIMAEHTKSLSANGSINFPKFVTRLYFLAIFPSAISVRLATIKMAVAMYFPYSGKYGASKKNTKNGINITRNIVSLFGKFMQSLLSNRIHKLRLPLPLQNHHSSAFHPYR